MHSSTFNSEELPVRNRAYQPWVIALVAGIVLFLAGIEAAARFVFPRTSRIAARVRREQAKAGDHGTPPKPEHVARTTLGEPSRAASGPPVAYGGAAPSTDGTADGTEGQTQGSSLRRDKHDSSARDGAMTAQIERTVASAEQEAADSNAGGASDPPATRVAEPPSVAAKDSHSGPASHRAKLIDAQLTARLNNGESRDQAVCEAIQQCFDVLVELHLEGGGTLNDQLLLRVFPDQVFELGVDLNWLPAAMGADRNF